MNGTTTWMTLPPLWLMKWAMVWACLMTLEVVEQMMFVGTAKEIAAQELTG